MDDATDALDGAEEGAELGPDELVGALLGFARTLRYSGVAATPDRVQAMITALDHLDVLVTDDVYWAGRLTLCAEPADLPRYDVAFAAYFADQALPLPPKSTHATRERTVSVEGGEEPSFGDPSENHDRVVRGAGQPGRCVAASRRRRADGGRAR